jgi:hypothetical protein
VEVVVMEGIGGAGGGGGGGVAIGCHGFFKYMI